MIPILPSSAVRFRFDTLHGCIRPDWESGLSVPNVLPAKTIHDITSSFNGAILVHCHVFYPSLLPELVRSWQHIPNRKVVITTSLAYFIPAIERVMSRLERSEYVIHAVPNRGRDIAPLLLACGASLLDDRDVILHCHTKRSVHVHNSFASGWRDSMLISTLSHDITFENVLPLFSQPSTALIFPWPHQFVAHNMNWGANYSTCSMLMNLIATPTPRYTYLYFPAGSFFWMRASLLRPLLELDLRFSDFNPEPLPNDGSLAHALERILGLLPYSYNMKSYAIWSGADVHGMHIGSPDKALVAMRTADDFSDDLKNLFTQGFFHAVNCQSPLLWPSH